MQKSPNKKEMKNRITCISILFSIVIFSCKSKIVKRENIDKIETIYLDTILPGSEIKTKLYIPTLDTLIEREGLSIQLKTVGDSLEVLAKKDSVKLQIRKTIKTKTRTKTKEAKSKDPKRHWAYLLGEFALLILSIFFFLSWFMRFIYDIWQNKQKNKQ